MKLAHLTDLHIANRECTEYRHAKAIVEHICTHHPDAVVVVTGDFVDNGTPQEFTAAAEALSPLASGCRLLLIAPGNHDVEWMGTFGRVDRTPFYSFRKRLTKAEAGYAYCMHIDGVQIVMIDTTAQAGGLSDLACGRVGGLQRVQLAKYLEIGDVHTRIVAGHHNLYEDDPTLELRDSAEVRSVLAGRCDLYLQGHDHRWGIWRDVDGIGWIADGGKSTAPHKGACRYRVFDIGEYGGIAYKVEEVAV